MSAQDFSFEGFETVEARIVGQAADIAYIILIDRTDRKQPEDQVGRFDFDEASAEPYLGEGDGTAPIAGPRMRSPNRGGQDGAEPDDGGYDDYGGDDEDGEDEGDNNRDSGEDGEDDEDRDDDSPDHDDHGWPPPPPTPDHYDHHRSPLTPADLGRAACRWVRECAIRNTVGDPYRRFRVRTYGPKGVRRLDSGQFVCRNHGSTADMDAEAGIMPDLRIPAPTFEQAASQGAVKGIQALGDYYAQWGRIVLGSVGQLQGVNNAMLARLHRQLQESRGQVDQLVASILEARVAEVQAHDGRRADEHAADARHQLARDALTQLGQAAQSFLLARGVPQDLVDSFQSISSSPDLVAALRDPRVRDLMKDPDNLRSLAAMLRAAGAQARPELAEPSAGSSPQPEPSAQG